MDWTESIEKPQPANLARVSGATDFSHFIRDGRSIASQVAKYTKELLLHSSCASPQILDFGAGCGRVALPMYFDHGLITHACDIDASAMSYLSRALPIDIRTTDFKPPLPYSDNTFDFVYSISIWTHLNELDQLSWLKEMRRILKPSGFLLISTSSYKAIEHRKHSMKIPAWQDVDPEQLREAGIIYRESATLRSHADKYFPGVTDSYGQTSNDPAYIINAWSQYFICKGHHINVVGGIQDMNILLNSKFMDGLNLHS